MTHVTNVTHIKQQTDDPPDVIIIVIIIIIFIKSCQNAADIRKINNSSYTTCVLTILLVNTIPHFCANIWPNHAVMITGRDSWPNCWGRRDGGLKAQYYPSLITLVTKNRCITNIMPMGQRVTSPGPRDASARVTYLTKCQCCSHRERIRLRRKEKKKI